MKARWLPATSISKQTKYIFPKDLLLSLAEKFSTSVWYKNRDLNEGEICVIQTSTFYIDYWNLQSLQNTKSWTNEPNTNNDNNTNTLAITTPIATTHRHKDNNNNNDAQKNE